MCCKVLPAPDLFPARQSQMLMHSIANNRLFTLTGPALVSTIPWYMVWWPLKHVPLKKTKVVLDEAAMIVQLPTSLPDISQPSFTTCRRNMAAQCCYQGCTRIDIWIYLAKLRDGNVFGSYRLILIIVLWKLYFVQYRLAKSGSIVLFGLRTETDKAAYKTRRSTAFFEFECAGI